MSTNSKQSTDRKRRREGGNRWGESLSSTAERSQKANNSQQSANTSNSISEEAAIAALVSSAESRIASKEPRKDTGGYRNQSGRGRTKGNDSGKNTSENRNDKKPRRNDRWGNPPSSNGKQPISNEPTWGKKDEKSASSSSSSIPPEERDRANFGLSGALSKDKTTGNTYNGVLLKFSEPPEARTPNTRWRLYVFRKVRPAGGATNDGTTSKNDNKKKDDGDDDDGGGLIEVMHIAKQSAYLFGREKRVADVLVEHPSLSRQHCVLQYRAVPDRDDANSIVCKPYLMDLGSAHGTFINGERLEEARYYELRRKDVITLGSSTREYVLLTENTT